MFGSASRIAIRSVSADFCAIAGAASRAAAKNCRTEFGLHAHIALRFLSR